MDPSRVADEITALSRSGGFLLAHLLTSRLAEHPVDTGPEEWAHSMPRSLADAVAEDLTALATEPAGITVSRGETARAMLGALPYAAGSGFPADIWAVAATAMAPTDPVDVDDVYALLPDIGRYVIVDGEGGVATYRLAHPQLVTALALATDGQLVALAKALTDRYLTLLREGMPPPGHPYLWQYTWRHCSDAGIAGIAALRELVDMDTNAFEPDLALSLNNLSNRQSDAGDGSGALASITEAVTIYRRLAAGNPARHDPDLAQSLNNLSVRQADAGDGPAALASITDAVTIHRRLAAANPARYKPALLHSLDVVMWIGDRFGEAEFSRPARSSIVGLGMDPDPS